MSALALVGRGGNESTRSSSASAVSTSDGPGRSAAGSSVGAAPEESGGSISIARLAIEVARGTHIFPAQARPPLHWLSKEQLRIPPSGGLPSALAPPAHDDERPAVATRNQPKKARRRVIARFPPADSPCS